VFKDSSIHEKLDDDYELDVDGHKLYFYHCVLDGALSIDRSRCGIIHMFGGGCFNGLSYTQHSKAKDANDSEVFTASSGCAQSIPYRRILREMGLNMSIATPIFSDSRSTRLIAISAAALKQSIYLARRVLFMREGISEGEYHFLTVLGKKNPVDGLTKYITLIAFVRSRKYMGVIAISKSMIVTTGKSPAT
jgi:hypothetical protein